MIHLVSVIYRHELSWEGLSRFQPINKKKQSEYNDWKHSSKREDICEGLHTKYNEFIGDMENRKRWKYDNTVFITGHDAYIEYFSLYSAEFMHTTEIDIFCTVKCLKSWWMLT